MSLSGHRHNIGRPTGLDIYNDAAKILDELLEKRISGNLRVPGKAKRKVTDPDAVGVYNTAARSKTGQLRLSKSLDDELSDKTYEQNSKTELRGGSESSIDTDYEELQVLDQRRKKSIFKRAKERLRHTFNRHQNEGIGRNTNKISNDLSASGRHKRKSKQGEKETDESYSKMNAQAEEDRSVKHTDERSNETSIHPELHSLIKRKGFGFMSLKTAKRSLSIEENRNGQHDKRGHTLDSLRDNNGDVRNKADGAKYVPVEGLPSPPQEPLKGSGITPLPLPPPPHPSSYQEPDKYSKSPPPPAAHHLRSSDDHTSNVPQSSHLRNPSPQHQALPSQSRSQSPSLKSVDLAASVDPRFITGATSTSSCNILQQDNTSDGSAQKHLSSTQSNALDSPGEDIEYMDDNRSEIGSRIDSVGGESYARTLPAIGVLSHGSEGLPTDVNFIATVIINSQEVVSEELPFQSRESDSKKEAIYGKIALKLIELGDLYSVSDPEVEGAAAPKPSLSDLEKDIIACLRTGGDRYSKQMDESFEEVTQQTTQEAYQRFQSTVQNSVGSDLSWDHLAFLFYTTKGVVSAVGSGSRSASRAKEFTLQYISDTFASWIMDQGGFNSVLSSAESDFDVD